jgi:hypothetical protein
MNIALIAILCALGLLAGILLLLEMGRRIGLQRMAMDAEGARAGLGTVEGAVFGLVGLLLAFTFSGASSRFDTRRQVIVEEANAIGTAYLRLDLLPAISQPALKQNFRRYLEARLAVFRKLPEFEAAKAELDRAAALQSEIWVQAVSACREAAQPATMLVLPALNEMIDMATTRTAGLRMHPPPVIFAMLIALLLAGSLLAGYGMAGSKTRSWLHILGFAVAMSVAVYVILDFEFPRVGLIRIDPFDQVLVDLRDSMK